MTPAGLDALALALPVGRDHGTSQKALARKLGWFYGTSGRPNTRKVQEGFLALRRERHLPVVAISRPNGCYIATPDDLDELKRTRNGLRSRAMSELVTVKEMDMVIADIEFSPTLFVLEEVSA